MPDSSNGAWRVWVGSERVRAVYKPISGEQQLWDFPDGSLAAREVAAHLISRAAGWDLIPQTVLRDGPLGPGSVQRWVGPTQGQELTQVRLDPGPVEGYLPVVALETPQGQQVLLSHADTPSLRSLSVLDAVLNNTDRKGSHVLQDDPGDADAPVLGIDQGLTCHAEPKLRTVLWGWAGDPLTADDLAHLERLAAALSADGDLREQLAPLLTRLEIEALEDRVAELLDDGSHPVPGDWHPLPWPLW